MPITKEFVAQLNENFRAVDLSISYGAREPYASVIRKKWMAVDEPVKWVFSDAPYSFWLGADRG